MDKIRDMQQIVGYNPDGSPITKKELINLILESQEDVRNGDYLTHEEFEKEMNKW